MNRIARGGGVYHWCKIICRGDDWEEVREASKLTLYPLRIDDINKNCLDQFRRHWECLDNNNQQLWHCRRPEQLLNACVFEKLVCLTSFTTSTRYSHRVSQKLTFFAQGLKKEIPGTPEQEVPVHLRGKQIFSYNPQSRRGREPTLPQEGYSDRASK